MPTTSDLRARARAVYLYLLVIDGCPFAFSTNGDLAGLAYLGDGREVIGGMAPPRWKIEVDYLDDGQFRRHPTTFEFLDISGRVSETFRDWSTVADPLFPGVAAGDDLAARADLHGQHLGTEAIGTAGERGRWPCVPGFALAQDHVGGDYDGEIAQVPVTSDPMILHGRRFALYRVFQDDDGSWRPLSESDRVLWGSVRKAVSIDGRHWRVECDGLESWVYRRIGRLSQQQSVKAAVVLRLDDTPGNDQRRVGIQLTTKPAGNEAGNTEEYGEDAFATIITGATTGEVRDQVSQAIDAAAAAVGSDNVFTVEGQSNVSMDNDGNVSIGIQNDAGGAPGVDRVPIMRIALHEKVWRVLGYDPALQHDLGDGDEHFVDFGTDPEYFADIYLQSDVPAPGYWVGDFRTSYKESDIEEQANVQQRIFSPLYKGGISVLDPTDPSARTILLGAPAGGVFHHTGQLDRPPASDPNDPTAPLQIDTGAGLVDVDTQGLWILSGKRSFDPFEDQIDETQVVRASWRRAALTLAQVLGDPPAIEVTGVLDPQDFGIRRPPLDGGWSTQASGNESLTLNAVPALRLGYQPGGHPSDLPYVCLRLLLTTGTSDGWTSFASDPAATLPATANEPVSLHPVRLDAEIADLGLAIPEEMVASPLAWGLVAEQLPQALRDVQILVLPGMDTEEIWRGLFGPVAWAWSLEGGRYGVLSLPQNPVPQPGDAVVTYREKATSSRDVGAHKVPADRTVVPIDEVTLRVNWHPLEQQYQREERMRSPDPGARYRHDTGGAGSHHEVTAIGYRGGLTPAWRGRLGDLCRWRAREHVVLRRYPLQRRTAQDLWPGSRVVLTEPRIARPEGGYGATGAVATVMAVEVDETARRGDGVGTFRVDLLVNRDSINGLRFHAPVAEGRIDAAVGHWYDAATHRIFVRDDMFAIGNGRLDVAHFVEPAWSSLGGDAEIKCLQWNGAEWSEHATGTVLSVNAVAGASYIQLTGALSGTARRDDEVLILLRDVTQQSAAWVLAFFSPICGKDGTFDGGAEQGYPWQ